MAAVELRANNLLFLFRGSTIVMDIAEAWQTADKRHWEYNGLHPMTGTMNQHSRLTPYDRQYPSCEETRAALRIYPESKSAKEITEFLGIEPTEAQDKGSLFTNSRGRTRQAPCTVWFLSSEDQISSRDLRDHLDWLLPKLLAVESRLLSLQEDKGTKMTIGCTWWSAAGHGGPTLWPEQMESLARLNLECGFDVYFFGDD